MLLFNVPEMEVGFGVMSICQDGGIPDLELAVDFAVMDRPDLPRDKDSMGPSGGR
jgi:hypothetical protein